MKPSLVLVALLVTSTLHAQRDELEVRTWQYERGGRMMIGLTPLPGRGDLEVRIHSGTPAIGLTWSPLRLDAGLAIYHDPDSTRVFGTVITGRVTERSSGSGGTQMTVHESRTPVALAAAHGEPIWFFPFGRPAPGERNLAFEILPAGTNPVPQHGQMPHTYVMDATNLRIVARPAAGASVRLAARGTDAQAQYEGTLQTHRPVTLAVSGRDGRAGIRVVLQPEPWDDDQPRRGFCLLWTWLDGDPPSGGLCLGGSQSSASQLLYGSGGVILRVEKLPS